MPVNYLIKRKYFKILLFVLFSVSPLWAGNAALLYNSDQIQNASAKPELQKWETLLLKWNINYKLVALDDFDESDIDKYSIAIGFNLTAATRSELSALFEFVSNGGRLILDSSIFEGGENFSNYERYFPKKFIPFKLKEFKKSGIKSGLILSSGTPLSAGIENGFKLPLRKQNISFEPESVELLAGGYFENSENAVGIVYGMIDSGKIVCFGVDVDFFSLNNATSVKLKRIIRNAFDWFNDKPQIWVGALPGNYSSALAFVCGIDRHLLGAFEAADFFKRENIRPTFLIRNEKYDADLLRKFIASGEVAFEIEQRTLEENEILNALKSEVNEFKNRNRLSKFRAVKGVRFTDDENLKVVKQMKRVPFDYVITKDKMSNSGLEIFDNGLVKFNAVGLDENISREFSTVDKTGGILAVEFSSSLFIRNEKPAEDFVNLVNEMNCWVTTLDQIAEWVKLMSNISVTFSVIDDNEIEIAVENKNSQTVYGAQIFFNDFFLNYQIKNENINGKYYQTDKKLTKLIINKIEPKRKEFFKLQKVNMVVKN